MFQNGNSQWLKEETLEVSGRSWFGFKSEMDKTIQRYEKNGWTLVKKEQVEGKKRFILHFGFREKSIIEKASKYRFLLYAIGIIIIIFTCSGFGVWSSYRDLQRTYYVTGNSINIRQNPNTNSQVVGYLEFRDSIEVLDTVEGSYVSGSNEWFEIKINGENAYVHSSLFSNSRPPIPPTPVPFIPTSPPRQWDCGIEYTCGNFSSCTQVRSFLNSCPAFGSSFDRDNDGIACESVCG